jgi:hypothetical protein
MEILSFKFLLFPFNIIITIILAFSSHILVDTFNIITYHTPEAHKDDKFWVIWHIIIYTLSGVSIIIFIIPFFLAVFFSNLMDLWDWVIIRPIKRKRKKENPESDWGQHLYMHVTVDWLCKNVFFWLPRRNYKKKGIVIEIVVIVIFTLLIFLQYI